MAGGPLGEGGGRAESGHCSPWLWQGWRGPSSECGSGWDHQLTALVTSNCAPSSVNLCKPQSRSLFDYERPSVTLWLASDPNIHDWFRWVSLASLEEATPGGFLIPNYFVLKLLLWEFKKQLA